MAGLGARLPLVVDENDGAYALLKTYAQMVKQNFKMLILTSPGERIMDTHFGVGLRRYIFENNTEDTYDDIATATYEQVARYMPHVRVDDIQFGEIADNAISITFFYTILPLSLEDAVSITQALD